MKVAFWMNIAQGGIYLYKQSNTICWIKQVFACSLMKSSAFLVDAMEL